MSGTFFLRGCLLLFSWCVHTNLIFSFSGMLTFGTLWHPLEFWFLTWSFLVLPLIHRSILISATCNLFSPFFLTAQNSAPYVIVGLITVLFITVSVSILFAWIPRMSVHPGTVAGILIGTLTMEMGGKVSIVCEKTGYRADVEFKLKVGGNAQCSYNILYCLHYLFWTYERKICFGRVKAKQFSPRSRSIILTFHYSSSVVSWSPISSLSLV